MLLAFSSLCCLVFLSTSAGVLPSYQQGYEESPDVLREARVRYFDAVDKASLLRASIITFQELGFFVDKADLDQGIVEAIKIDGQEFRMKISVLPAADARMEVRVDAWTRGSYVRDPEQYRSFLLALDRMMILGKRGVR